MKSKTTKKNETKKRTFPSKSFADRKKEEKRRMCRGNTEIFLERRNGRYADMEDDF